MVVDNNYAQSSIVVLFLVLAAMVFYVMRTSGERERRLTSLLEHYSEQLSRLTLQLDEVSHNVADIARRFERMELRTSQSGINISGGAVTVGRDAVSGDVSKRDDLRSGGNMNVRKGET
jgi:hypothetical protein